MNEKLLQFIWQHQYFNRTSLTTEQGEELEITDPGFLNTNQGADFIQAKVRISKTTWAGNVELHVLASDWHRHNHDEDPNYKNIVLHVVWINDALQQDNSLLHLPLLELQPRVSHFFLKKYEELMQRVKFIPCENYVAATDTKLLNNWKEVLVMERLKRKSAMVLRLLRESNFHWEETLWWAIARNFGLKLNGDAFELLARSLPLKILGKHKSQLQQLEALLFGQAGLLNRQFIEDYPILLQKEYRFLSNKYGLRQPALSLKYLRMRPQGFPTLRIAQLAMLIKNSTHLFSKIRDIDTIPEVKELLDITANDYWHYHYRFDELSSFQMKTVGNDMVENLLINTIIPLLYTYGVYQNQPSFQQKATEWLRMLPAEKNAVVNQWNRLGIPVKQAFDSQALIELKTVFCEKKRCLECPIGNALISTGL